jgi:hypothetical protein
MREIRMIGKGHRARLPRIYTDEVQMNDSIHLVGIFRFCAGHGYLRMSAVRVGNDQSQLL